MFLLQTSPHGSDGLNTSNLLLHQLELEMSSNLDVHGKVSFGASRALSLYLSVFVLYVSTVAGLRLHRLQSS